ncbi:MAG: YggT family protein [Gammaproteobacteria bacterium]|nr:YggT family protein [Gammaproteobacteria bacterium]MCW5583724.1 YggT family protein [Gammaproteobacteria bacterium]
MSGTSLNAILFLISTLFDFYIIILIMRLILAWVKSDYYHPVTQFVVRFTSFIVKPLKKFLPDVRGFELSTLVLIILIEALKYFIITILSFGLPNIIGLFILAIGDSLRLMFETLSLALILQVIISWVHPGSPIYQLLYKLTSPIVRPIQRFVPPIAGVDISPLPAIILLQLLIIVLVNPMKGLGLGMAIGT